MTPPTVNTAHVRLRPQGSKASASVAKTDLINTEQLRRQCSSRWLEHLQTFWVFASHDISWLTFPAETDKQTKNRDACIIDLPKEVLVPGRKL